MDHIRGTVQGTLPGPGWGPASGKPCVPQASSSGVQVVCGGVVEQSKEDALTLCGLCRAWEETQNLHGPDEVPGRCQKVLGTSSNLRSGATSCHKQSVKPTANAWTLGAARVCHQPMECLCAN